MDRCRESDVRKLLVRMIGLEPTLPRGNWNLNPARLPVSPHPHDVDSYAIKNHSGAIGLSFTLSCNCGLTGVLSAHMTVAIYARVSPRKINTASGRAGRMSSSTSTRPPARPANTGRSLRRLAVVPKPFSPLRYKGVKNKKDEL
jgi:hypothetical protein